MADDTCKACGHTIENPKKHFRCENVHAVVNVEEGVIEVFYVDDAGDEDANGQVAFYRHEALALAEWLVEAADLLDEDA